MIATYTIAFVGHRYIDNPLQVQDRIEDIARDLIRTREYVEFLVGRDGDFDLAVASAIIRAKRGAGDNNSALVWVLPYDTAEFENNKEDYLNYYDEVEVCAESCSAHFKSAIQIRNRNMVDRADLLVCFVEKESGGAYQTMKYAEKQGKPIINLAKSDD